MVYTTIQRINRRKILGAVICALLCVGLWGKKVLADERYQETQAYQEYLLLPDSYKSPQMEAKFKHSFEAERSVKNQRCTTGETVARCLDTMSTQKGYNDLGWRTSGNIGQFLVERMFVTWDGKAITYRWSVDGSGIVKRENKEALKISTK